MKSKYLFFLLGVIATASFVLTSFRTTPENALAKDQMIADWNRAKAYTADYINSSNDTVISSRPTPEMRSFAQQMLHLAEANFAIAAAASGKATPYTFGQLEKSPAPYATKQALSKIVAESYDFAIEAIKSLDESKLGEKIKLFNWELTRQNALEKAFEHQTHHRGQTTVYLRLNGIKPPEERLF